MGFGAEVRSATRLMAQALQNTASDTTIQVFSLVIVRSPVQDGVFRASWRASTNRPADGMATSGAGSAQPTIDEMEAIVKALRGGGIVFLTNNQPYGPRLEFDGWSDQAPQGMVRRTVAQAKQIAADAARKNRL